MLNMKIGEGKASNQFPAGLRVLVVDDDPTCLIITEKMLRGCFYEVTTCSQAAVALSLLRERKQAFDIVLSDVHMPDMDGFKLLECIGLEMDLPVIMMSVDDKQDVVMKGITHGACDYLLKPLRLEAIKTIWQHVVRKQRKGLKELEQLGGVDDASGKTCVDAADHSSSINEGSWRNSKRRKEEEDETEERDETSALKKQRVVWSVELHQQFVTAVNQLGIEKAVPKKILELMNVPGLTRENVASHLQKYRLYLKRINGGSQHHIGLNTSFMYPQEANFDPSSLNGLDIQALAVSKIPRQCLPSPCGGILNQRDLFAVEAMKLEIAAQQQQQRQISGANENVDLIRGPPSIIKSKQLHHLQQRVLSLGSPNLPIDERAHDTLGTSSSTCLDTLDGCTSTSSLMMDMVQSRLRGQVLNGPIDNSSRIPLSTGFHQIQSNKIMDSFAERNACALHGQHGAYNPIPISSSLIEDYGIVDLPGNAFPLGNSTLDLPIHHSTDMVLDGRLELKESRGLTGGYEFKNVDLTFDTSRPSGFMQKCNVECFPSVLCHQGLKQGETESVSIASSKSVVPSTKENEQQTFEASALQCDNLPVSAGSFRVKGEKLPDLTRENMIFTQHFGQDDLMNSIFMQQEGIAPVDNEFKF